VKTIAEAASIETGVAAEPGVRGWRPCAAGSAKGVPRAIGNSPTI